MRLDMELEFDKYCVIDGSPTTVLPLHRQPSKTEKRRSKGYSRYPNDVFSLKEEAIARSFNRYRSASCKTGSSRKVSTESNEARKRGSVYQSSKEVRLMQKTDSTQERKKIELSSNSDTPLSYGIVESLCSSDEDNIRDERRDSVMSLRSDLRVASTSKSHIELNPVSNRIKQICVDSDIMGGDKRRDSVMSLRSDLSTATTSKSHVKLNPVSDRIKHICVDSDLGGNRRATTKTENEQITNMNGTCKSLSAKLTLPHSPACSETDSSKATSPKGQFGQVRRVLDPFVKSKPHNTPITSSSEQHIETPSKMKTLRKSLLHDFSNIGHWWQNEETPMKQYRHLNSPAHLQGLLKVVQKHGVPYFEFSVKAPEELYIAKIWKSDNALDWIYTFHSSHDGRKSNASGKGSKDSSKLSSIVGQMHVSCYLRTDPNGYGVSDNSMVSEFILYNVVNSRRSVVDSSRVYADVAKAPKVHDENSVQRSHNADEISVKGQQLQQQGRSRHSTRDDSPPLAHTELLTHLQAAATVVQVPFEEHFADCTTSSAAKVNAVMPCGLHSLPTATEESQRPSPLLDRWRTGGGCDCGGWDLACPLNVLRNPTVQIREDVLMENCQPLDLFIQGKKDNTPALSIRKTEEEGHYTVDFHAQLSTLQAFSVSMAVLHATEPSLGFAHEQKMHLLRRDSLEAFTNAEKVETLIDTKKTIVVNKNMRKGMPSFMVKPPFSPIARV